MQPLRVREIILLAREMQSSEGWGAVAPAGLPKMEYPKVLAHPLVGTVGLVLPFHSGVSTKLGAKIFVINEQEKQGVQHQPFPPWCANAQEKKQESP